MAGPLSGIGGQAAQQIPAANTFKPGEQVRQQEEQQQTEETVQSSEANDPVETHRAETDNTDVVQAQQSDALQAGSNEGSEQERGSVVDVLV